MIMDIGDSGRRRKGEPALESAHLRVHAAALRVQDAIRRLSTPTGDEETDDTLAESPEFQAVLATLRNGATHLQTVIDALLGGRRITTE